MKKKVFILALALVQLYTWGQAPAIQWQKTLGGRGEDQANSIQPTADGGYILAGFTTSSDGDVSGNHGDPGFWIIKLSSTGDLQWQKCFGGLVDDRAYSIQPTSDGGYIFVGSGLINGDISGYHGSVDALVVKFSSAGDLLWRKYLGGSNTDILYSIQPTVDGGYILAGISGSYDGDVSGIIGGGDAWVVKLSGTGELQWQKCLGGTGDDAANSIQPTTDGGYIVAGSTNSTDGDVIRNHGGYDYWVVKLSGTGELQWQKCLGGTANDLFNSIQPTSDGGYIVAGVTFSTDGDVTGYKGGRDSWIVKLSGIGEIQWQKCIGGKDEDNSYSIQKTSDGGYIMAGYTYSTNGDVIGNHGAYDAWIIKLSSTGELQWQKCLGGTLDEFANSINPTADGGYIVAGYTYSTDGDITGNHGGDDAWVVKLAPDTMGVSVFANTPVNIYPNPATGVITIQNPANVVIDKMIVTDLSGKMMLEQSGTSNQINVVQLASGTYILKVFYGKETAQAKFIKE